MSLSQAAPERQAPRLGAFARHQPRQVVGRAERPLAADLDEVDATQRVLRLQLSKCFLHVDAIRHALRQRRLIQRLARSEQQRFQQPQFFRPCTGLRGTLLDLDDALLGQTCHGFFSFHFKH